MKILIFGAGKIARGFIGHLLWKAGLYFQFIEYNPQVVSLLETSKQYSVRVLGETIHTDQVTNFGVWGYEDIELIEGAIATEIETIFIAVGGKNLSSVGVLLKQALKKRMEAGTNTPLNIVLCENWIKPADVLKDIIYEGISSDFALFLDEKIGITESVIIRSAIEPTKDILAIDPLAVNVQDFWYLPVDKKRLKSELPDIPALDYIDDFGGYLDRKFYTYNAANGTISYLGSLKNYTYISDAARDPDILAILEKVYLETGKALCAKHGFDFDTHMEFTRTSLKKLQNKFLVDYVERNARDPIRKLGPTDRLVGPARLVITYGGVPEALSTAIAAAIFYEELSDPIAMRLKEIREQEGIDYILHNICKLDENKDNVLIGLIKSKIEMLKEWGWIK